ncbi:hypothetical protein BV20DRAFT_235155 [Pilatotrama ljubarskyi]|nr:hypothetical protein BV20DRAFT_235155 [Pilatotrama ljubarskyi]
MSSAHATTSTEASASAASATDSAPQPSASPSQSAAGPSQPSDACPTPVGPKPKPSALADLRQLTLENGRIIDLPYHILRDPPPRPTDFLHLQHYFETRAGEPTDLSQCKTADEAIDLLADEIEAIRLLLYGYILNFKQYVERFEEAHDDLRKEVMSVAESYEGLGRLIVPAAESARTVEEQFFQLQRKVKALPVGGGRKPPRILRRRAPANAPLSAEENREILRRQGVHHEESAAIKAVALAQKNLSDAALLKEVLDPQPPATEPQPESAKPFPLKLPFDHNLSLKINKVVDDVDQAREELYAAQAVTSQNLGVLRYYEDEAYRDARELWSWYDMMQRCTMTAGRLSGVNKYVSIFCTECLDIESGRLVRERVEAFTKWADKCAEDAAAFARSAAPAAPDAPQEASENQGEDLAGQAAAQNGDAASACPAGLSVDNASAAAAPPAEGDVYALSLELSCEKPYDELTREEAIAVLKSLPLRVQFMPFAYPSRPSGLRCNGDGQDAGAVDGGAKSSEATEIAAAPEAASPGAPDREQRSTEPNSRKRARDDDVEADTATEGDGDSRPKAGGSPVKRKRGGH